MREVSLSEHIQEISMGPFGSNIKVDNFISNGVPVLNGSNLTKHKLVEDGFKYVSESKANSLGKANAKRGDIVITHRGTLGQVAYIPNDSKFERYVISQSQFRVRFKVSVSPIYFSYLMMSSYGQKKLLSFKNHVGVPALAQATTNFKLLKLFIPNITIQDNIASVLSALDDKIELNNKISAELEAMAKTLYDYWFVQFDFPNPSTSSGQAGKPYKSSGGEMVYDEVLKRDIPKGWEVKSLKEFAKTGSGGTPLKSKTQYFKNGNIPWINSGEVNESFIISAKKYITNLGLESSSAKLFPKRTILMAMYGATAGQVSLLDIEACTNQAICGIMPTDYRFIAYTKFGLNRLYQYLINLSTGSARDNLSQDKIKELNFVIPPEKIIDQFHNLSESYLNKVLNNLKQNQELASLRDWLLPMLMNGQVKVAGAESVINEKLGLVAEPSPSYKQMQNDL